MALEIFPGLFQFTEFIEPIKLSLHQYLLLTEEPVLIHTGTRRQARAILPQIRQLLGDRKLKYVLVSHFESDECGGLSELVAEYPDLTAVCSELCARQLTGFGITDKVEIKKPGDVLTGRDFDFEFINYPSEIHLQNGLLFLEKQRGIFFSSDLMFRMGDAHGKVIESDWKTEIDAGGVDRLPNDALRVKMEDDLNALDPVFIAAGHGPCVKL